MLHFPAVTCGINSFLTSAWYFYVLPVSRQGGTVQSDRARMRNAFLCPLTTSEGFWRQSLLVPLSYPRHRDDTRKKNAGELGHAMTDRPPGPSAWGQDGSTQLE